MSNGYEAMTTDPATGIKLQSHLGETLVDAGSGSATDDLEIFSHNVENISDILHIDLPHDLLRMKMDHWTL